ncbi:IclR family transcriptional regulator [Fictibacillus enclensis]|uniref:IclR family transcriptional regulator n=1 Tax=Fictibacillus enclensis TaxID=1017270 RepID=UPI0025A1434C|nr:IclR family transcriptional regulator [Fictibacillus enclensis]MDM5336620.1 IclR family transcriptional regulator [Fictibacillus enclensis]
MAAENVTSIDKALTIMESISHTGGESTLHEIYLETQIPKSTIKRILETLIQREYVKQIERSGVYQLGVNVLVLGGVYQKNMNVRGIAFPFMKSLSKELNETVNLNVVDNGERVCVEVIEPIRDIRHFVSIGHRSELYRGSTGKAMLAFLQEFTQEKVIAKAAQDSINVNVLRKELQIINKNGYAITRGERIRESFSVSAPVFNQNGEMIAGLTVSGPIQRLTREREPDIIASVIVAAKEVSRQLGYQKSNRRENYVN